MRPYALNKTVAMDFDHAVAAVTEQLAMENFGVLSDIDVAATMKKKLGIDMPPYRILGACNPQFARRALDVDPQIGTLLPCNVVVRCDSQGRTQVDFMDPDAVLRLVDRPEIGALADEVRQRLQRVMAALD
jgi:uncharacterized protein (DUF302 family)